VKGVSFLPMADRYNTSPRLYERGIVEAPPFPEVWPNAAHAKMSTYKRTEGKVEKCEYRGKFTSLFMVSSGAGIYFLPVKRLDVFIKTRRCLQPTRGADVARKYLDKMCSFIKFSSVARWTDGVEKGLPTIETAGPKSALRSLRILRTYP